MSTLLFALAAGLSTPALAHSDHHGHHSRHASHQRPAKTGTLRVDNDTGRSLALLVDGRLVQQVRPGVTYVTVSKGSHGVALLAGDRTIVSRSVKVSSGGTASVRAEAPSAGLVVVTNHESYEVIVYVDGRRSGRIPAYGSTSIEVHGQARVDLVDERGSDRMLTTRNVDVGCYDVVGISWGTAVASSGHSSGHVRPR